MSNIFLDLSWEANEITQGREFSTCFKQCPVHTIDWQKESFFGLFKEFEVSNIQSNGVRTGGVLYDKMFQIPVYIS